MHPFKAVPWLIVGMSIVTVRVTASETIPDRNFVVDRIDVDPEILSPETKVLRKQYPYMVGVIESCSGKLPILKSFLKDGEAECYHNITIQFIPNSKPVLILYNAVASTKDADSDMDLNSNTDSHKLEEIQRIPLHEYLSKDQLHHLLLNELGFELKNEFERAVVLQNAQQIQYDERLQQHIRHEYYRWRTIYVTEFRTNVIGISVQEYEQQIYNKKHQSRYGPIHDYLNDNYDTINQKVAGAYKEDRLSYATRYLEKHYNNEKRER